MAPQEGKSQLIGGFGTSESKNTDFEGLVHLIWPEEENFPALPGHLGVKERSRLNNWLVLYPIKGRCTFQNFHYGNSLEFKEKEVGTLGFYPIHTQKALVRVT